MADQFEIEATPNYSGSYIAETYFGDVLSGGFIPSANERRLLTSKINKSVSDYLDQAYTPYWIVEGFASGSYVGKTQRFVRVFSDKETFFDSHVPNPLDIHLKTASKLAWFSDTLGVGEGTRWGIFDISGSTLVAGSGLIVQVWSGMANPTGQYLPDTAIDTEWHSRFPFESKYKGIRRLITFSTKLPRTYEADTDIWFGTTLTPVSNSNFLGGAAFVRNGLTRPVLFLGYMKKPGENYPHTKVESITFASFAGSCPIKLYFDAFFGFKLRKFDDIGQDVGQVADYVTFPASSTTVMAHTAKIRGYKYGLLATQPVQTSAVYRTGRFGQLRDMLEQRIYSKLTDKRKGASTTQAAVTVRFVSGTLTHSRSIDYATASNPDYNPTDSGQFDFEYKSGQPFFDDIDLSLSR
jgi:hypothetical protein